MSLCFNLLGNGSIVGKAFTAGLVVLILAILAGLWNSNAVIFSQLSIIHSQLSMIHPQLSMLHEAYVETHLFDKRLVASVQQSALAMKGCTAFPVMFKNGLYLVTAAHCYSRARSDGILAHLSADVALVGAQIFNETIKGGKVYPLILPDIYINVSMGDKLVAVGYDENASLRIWAASTYSVSGFNILTGGDQMSGMSGCAVFNGCGLVGIAVSNNLKFMKLST